MQCNVIRWVLIYWTLLFKCIGLKLAYYLGSWYNIGTRNIGWTWTSKWPVYFAYLCIILLVRLSNCHLIVTCLIIQYLETIEKSHLIIKSGIPFKNNKPWKTLIINKYVVGGMVLNSKNISVSIGATNIFGKF